MALEVEDGTGKVDANSYASILEADTLLTARNHAGWLAASLAQKEAALIEGADWIEAYDYNGWASFTNQALSFPRYDLYDREGRLVSGVPAQVKKANILLAADALSGPLRPATTATSGALKRKKVGPLELEYFEGSAGSSTARSFPEASSLLRGLIRGGPGGISGRVERWS